MRKTKNNTLRVRKAAIRPKARKANAPTAKRAGAKHLAAKASRPKAGMTPRGKVVNSRPAPRKAAGTARAGAKPAQKQAVERKAKINSNVYPPEEVERVIGELSSNDAAVGYLKKNVSKRTIDVMTQLVTPKTDEALATSLDMKINAVRRILNIMQGYGITNYYVSKNVNGWLSFAWYINVSKMRPFFEYITNIESKKPIVTSECNDYFLCNDCYGKTKLVFTFDAAFEENFKCGNCGSGLVMISREQAVSLSSGEMQHVIELAQP